MGWLNETAAKVVGFENSTEKIVKAGDGSSKIGIGVIGAVVRGVAGVIWLPEQLYQKHTLTVPL